MTTRRSLRCLPRAGLRGRSRAGFTLIEVLVAVSLLGFSLIVMFGYHRQALRSNMHARRITDCTYLAQTQMERLLSLPWSEGSRPSDLDDLAGADPTSTSDAWAWLEHPNSGSAPTAVNALGGTDTTYGAASYYITWDVQDMDTDATWARVRVRCTYYDADFDTYHGTTISSYRYRDS